MEAATESAMLSKDCDFGPPCMEESATSTTGSNLSDNLCQRVVHRSRHGARDGRVANVLKLSSLAFLRTSLSSSATSAAHSFNPSPLLFLSLSKSLFIHSMRRRATATFITLPRLIFKLVAASPTATMLELPTEEGGEAPGSSAFWYKLVISIGLVLLGGIFAGCVVAAACGEHFG